MRKLRATCAYCPLRPNCEDASIKADASCVERAVCASSSGELAHTAPSCAHPSHVTTYTNLERQRRQRSGEVELDYAAGAALSLAQVALYSGDRVAMLAYGRRVQQRIAAGRGSRHVRLLLEGLAQVKGEELEADHQRAAEALLTFQKRRSLVVWLTDLSETATTPEVIESASRLAHRHLVLFTVIGQPELRELLRRRPENPRQMFHHVTAQEIVQRRDVLLRSLRQQGVLTLEVEPNRLSSAIVNQYLGAKERSLI